MGLNEKRTPSPEPPMCLNICEKCGLAWMDYRDYTKCEKHREDKDALKEMGT